MELFRSYTLETRIVYERVTDGDRHPGVLWTRMQMSLVHYAAHLLDGVTSSDIQQVRRRLEQCRTVNSRRESHNVRQELAPSHVGTRRVSLQRRLPLPVKLFIVYRGVDISRWRLQVMSAFFFYTSICRGYRSLSAKRETRCQQLFGLPVAYCRPREWATLTSRSFLYCAPWSWSL